ncbi:MAG: hypothetical protein LBP62_04950 [Clostridiales bacterium]|jgi:hypothetical protein|nr:hypothetical protein [Clostridiales bacterium]
MSEDTEKNVIENFENSEKIGEENSPGKSVVTEVKSVEKKKFIDHDYIDKDIIARFDRLLKK